MIIVIKNRGITLIHFLFANSRNRRQTKRGNTKKGNHDKVTGGSSKKRKKKRPRMDGSGAHGDNLKEEGWNVIK